MVAIDNPGLSRGKGATLSYEARAWGAGTVAWGRNGEQPKAVGVGAGTVSKLSPVAVHKT